MSAEAIRARRFNRIVMTVLPPQACVRNWNAKGQEGVLAPLVRDFEECVWLLSSETLERQLRDWSPGSASGILSSAVVTRRAPKSCVAIATQANQQGGVEATNARWSVAQNLQVVECSMTHESGCGTRP